MTAAVHMLCRPQARIAHCAAGPQQLGAGTTGRVLSVIFSGGWDTIDEGPAGGIRRRSPRGPRPGATIGS